MKLKNKLVSFLWNIYLKNPNQAIAQQEYSDFQTFFQFCVCVETEVHSMIVVNYLEMILFILLTRESFLD